MEEDTVFMLQKYNSLLSVSATVRGEIILCSQLKERPGSKYGNFSYSG